MVLSQRHEAQTRDRLESCRAEVARELGELQLEYQVKLSDKTREHVDRNYWTTLTELLKRGNHLSLPAGYELENVNWIHTFFDYLTTDPAQAGGHAFELEYLIPDTIIIKQRRAYAWLTANKSPIVRKDKITELQPKYIFEGLCAAYRRKNGTLQPHNVLAYLLVTPLPTANNPKPVPAIEYFNAAMLQTYLFERLRTDDCTGILQLFIPPPGTRNAVIRAWWTPYSLRIEQRANKNDLESAHTPISDRSSTFDGHMHNSEIRNMHGEDLRDEVAEQLEWIIDHLSALLPYTHQIWSGVFYFKMGFDGRLYLLWCSSLQFERAKHNHSAPTARPPTPRCIHSEEQRAETEESQDASTMIHKDTAAQKPGGPTMRLGLNGTSSSKNDLCPSCGRTEGDPLCSEIAYSVRYLSLVRHLNVELYEAVRAEAHIALICSSTAEQWAEYLRRSEAARHTYYGEDVHTKFPRPTPQVPAKSFNASRALQAGRMRTVQRAPSDEESARSAAEAEAEDRRQLRQIVQAYCPNAAAAPAATPATPGCSKLMEMTQSKKDLDDCTAPLDYVKPAPALVSAARPLYQPQVDDNLSTAPPSHGAAQDFSHLVTRLKTNTERLNEVWLAQQASMAQTDDFKRRSQHVLSGSDDKILLAPDARKVAAAMQDLREALRPEWEKQGLALHAKPKKASVIKRTPSRSKTMKSLIKDGDPHLSSLKNIMGNVDTPSPEAAAVSRTASGASAAAQTPLTTYSGAWSRPGSAGVSDAGGGGDGGVEAKDVGLSGSGNVQSRPKDRSGMHAQHGQEQAAGQAWLPVASRFMKPQKMSGPIDAKEGATGLNSEASTPGRTSGSGQSPGARGILARKSQIEQNRAAFQRWQNHFDVSNELDVLSFSHIEAADIQEEMSETQEKLAGLALRIEQECGDQQYVIQQLEAANKGLQGSNEALAATGARPDNVRKAVPGVSLNRMRTQNKTRVLEKFMSPRLRRRALSLYQQEQESQQKEEEERRAALNQVRWSSTAFLIQLRLRNEALASLRHSAIEYAHGAYDEQLSEDGEGYDVEQRRGGRHRQEQEQEQRRDHLRQVYGNIDRERAVARTGEQEHEGQAAVGGGIGAPLEAGRDSHPSLDPSRPPLGAAAASAAPARDRAGTAGEQPRLWQGLADSSMRELFDVVAATTPRDDADHSAVDAGPAEQDDQERGNDRGSDGRGDDTKQVATTATKRICTSNTRIKKGKASADVEEERVAWKLRIKEREAEREAERARKHEQKQFVAPPLPPLKGEAYIKTSEDIKKRYMLTEAPNRSKPSGGGLLLPGGALLLPLKHQPARSSTSLGLLRVPAQDVVGEREAEAARPTTSLDHAHRHRSGPGASPAHAMGKRFRSAYKTTFIEAYDPVRSIGTVYLAGRPRTSTAPAPPAWHSASAGSVAKEYPAGTGKQNSQKDKASRRGKAGSLPVLNCKHASKTQHYPPSKGPHPRIPLDTKQDGAKVAEGGAEREPVGEARQAQDDSAPQEAMVVEDEEEDVEVLH